MKASLKMERRVDLVFIFITMETNILENGRMMIIMVKAL